MWQFYLAGAVSAFRNDGHEVFQLQLTRRRDALPIVRDYMGAAEAALARPFDLPQGDARGST
jgi:cyclopropane-fatty-acyl-phospholipid synthase